MDTNEIEKLIMMPKIITETPAKEFKQEDKHLRKDFTLQSKEGDLQFGVFIRRHIEYQENFSIGLVYYPADDKSMILFRCNGNHGEVVEDPLRPSDHFDYHTHTITSDDIQKGIREPSFSGVTKDYASYEEAFVYFIKRANIQNADKYFDLSPKLFKEL
jgi:hypothetical protein